MIKAPNLAISYNYQIFDNLPSEERDIKVEGLLNESEMIFILVCRLLFKYGNYYRFA